MAEILHFEILRKHGQTHKQTDRHGHYNTSPSPSGGEVTRLLGRPQPQMYPPVALNQYTWVNRTQTFKIYMLQGPTNILKFGFYFH